MIAMRVSSVIALLSTLGACSSAPPKVQPLPPSTGELIARYEQALRTVLHPRFSEAVIDYARSNGQPDQIRVEVVCAADGVIDDKERQLIPDSVESLYTCAGFAGNDLLGWNDIIQPNGKTSRDICIGRELFTADEFDGDLERDGPKADLRADCMDAAEQLAGLYREQASRQPAPH